MAATSEFDPDQQRGPVDIQLIHEDVATLETAAERLASEIASYSGLRDIDSGVTKGKEQLDFHLTDVAIAQGLSEMDLARQVRASFFGSEALRQQRGRDEVRVYVRLPREERGSLYHVDNLVIRTPAGGEMPVAEAATVSRGQAYTVINRTDGRRNISITADIADEDTNSNEINAQIRRRELPQLVADIPGLAYDLSGEQQRQAETMNALGLGFLLALITIFSILAVAFRSYAQPLLVMSGIPFGMVGAVNRYREDEGLGLWEAVLAGGARRFRPILLTSLTTFFGLAPMILELNARHRRRMSERSQQCLHCADSGISVRSGAVGH